MNAEARICRYEERLVALRAELARRALDGFVVPLTDEHMSEYVSSYAQRLAWLTGFQGSAGSAVVLSKLAAIFVDGRYALQVRHQVDGRHWGYESVPQTNAVKWLGDNAHNGARIGYDPWLHTQGWVTSACSELAERGVELIPVDINPIDAIWRDHPHRSDAKLLIHPDEIAGKSSAAKRQEIADWLNARRADAVVLTALDSIAWTLNVRGQDIEHTPVAFAFALVNADSTVDLFVQPEKLTDDVVAHLGSAVRCHSQDAFVGHLAALSGKTIAVDPARAVVVIFDTLTRMGAKVLEAHDPVVLPKAIKNAAEIAGHRAAQTRDGAALTRFLHWLSTEISNGNLSELSAEARLREFREASGKLRDLSFDTVSAFGPNGAIVHYRATKETNRRITTGSLYLVDSGAQYMDGTTDVTRTVAIGEPTLEMRDRFTRVLKGHIALASAIFPPGTCGLQIDALARQYLWTVGLDYAHATGHGVGAYLGVHEGPHRIAHTGICSEPLVPGMILSNEPGYYKAGHYGIRIENLMLVVKRSIAGAERDMLGFETLTFAPIDRALIDVGMLTGLERAWIDSYHADVARFVGPQLEGPARTWLMETTRPLD